MPNFDKLQPLPNETSEDMATRLAGDLELTPLEGESPMAQEAAKKLESVPDPAAEAVRVEQARQDEEARSAELARADALEDQIKNGKVLSGREISQGKNPYIESVKASAAESESKPVFAQLGLKIKEAINLLSEMSRDAGKVNVRGDASDLESVVYGFKSDFESVLSVVASVDVAERMYMNEEEELLLSGRLSRLQQQAETLPSNYGENKNIAKVAGVVRERVAELQGLAKKLGADVQRARNLL